MPDIYDVNLTDASPTIAQQLLPVDKRASTNTQLLQSLFSPLQWVRDLWLGTYRLGDSSAQWGSTVTYNQYDRVQYQKQVWEALQANNINMLPVVGSTFWQLVQPNFIGLSERLMYNGQCIVLTYALNKWFGTPAAPCNFVQPSQAAITQVARASNIATITADGHGYTTGQRVQLSVLTNSTFSGVYIVTVVDANTFTYSNTSSNLSATTDAGTTSPLSTIYISTNTIPVNVFVCGATEGQSSISFANTSSAYIINSYSFATPNNFTIYVPTAVIDVSITNNLNIFKSFAGKYIPSGIIYNVVNY